LIADAVGLEAVRDHLMQVGIENADSQLRESAPGSETMRCQL